MYIDEDNLNMNIIESDTTYMLTDKNGNTMKFVKNNDVGYLAEYIDPVGNKITIFYDSNNRINKIVDANNQEINIKVNSK